MKKLHKYFYILAFMAFTLTASGCDMVDGIKEYFSKDKNKEQSSQVATPQKSKQSADRPLAADGLAKVGPWQISIHEFNERLSALKEVVPDLDLSDLESKELILEELIRQQLIVLDAEKKGIHKNKDIVSAVEEFRRTLIVREAARILTENVKASENDMYAFYEKNKDLLIAPEEYRVSEIVVADEQKAQAVYNSLMDGGDFAQLAQENSIAQSAAVGGEVGFVTEGGIPEIDAALSSMRVGDVSNVIDGPDGYYILKVHEKTGGGLLTFEQVKEEVEVRLTLEKQQERIMEHIEALRKQYKIEKKTDLLK